MSLKAMFSILSMGSPPNKIDVRGCIWAMTFAANGKYLVTRSSRQVQVWRVQDGKEMATMNVIGIQRLAVSMDGRCIATGDSFGNVFVWDAETYTQVFGIEQHSGGDNLQVDFSPDSTRLVITSRSTAAVWDLALGKKVQTLHHDRTVIIAKYSPQGDRIATATYGSVRVYGSNDGRLLVDILVSHSGWCYDFSLLWFNNYLLVISDDTGTIKKFEASTGSAVSEWPAPNRVGCSCIALSKHGEFIAYSTRRTVTFWDTSTHTLLGLIEHPQDIYSIALSPGDRYLALGADAKITFQGLSHITDSIQLSRLNHTFQEPDIQIDATALDLWEDDRLEDAEALMTAAITESQNPGHNVLVSRALVRARLQRWDTALVDAEKATEVQPSAAGYIAKGIVLVGMGKRDKGYQACDIALKHFHSDHNTFILLAKAIIMFTAGEHGDAISRVDDLIATVHLNSICYVVEAYIYLLGNLQMQTSDYEGAMQSFERARSQVRQHTSRPLLMVSLIFGWKFDNLDFTIQQRLCEVLHAADRTKDALEYFHQITSKFGEEMHREWTLDFSQRFCEKWEHLGDTAVDAERYDEAISHYTTSLSLNSPSPQSIFIKRSKAFLAIGSWKQALDDANQVIALNPSLPWGYEMKHAVLHNAGDYRDAVDALEVMVSKIVESPDPDVQRLGAKYINPSSTRATIYKIVQRTISHFPRVLINTTTGCLHNKADQASSFESLPIFKELVSSTTTRVDNARIKREVRQYFRYVMLSHKWEENEPLFQQVILIAVYDLDQSPTHDKLQSFCKIVRDAGFNWAWSDTCCINKSDHFSLQEALVAMFRWYQGSAMVIVFLRGVRSSSQRGALVNSIWNTRAWTLQEYVASKVIHFYTEDWTLYLDLEWPNHKESPEVISEMEQATGVSARQLMALRPGLSSIREKLRLASTRQTTLVEDAAYSLLGIFSVAGIPAMYGEGEGALGRLLAHVLAGSGDVSILAWTGESGSFNSSLPTNITVFNGPPTSHLPEPIPDVEMERIITASHSSSFDLDVALRLYDRLNELPAPWFAASRMKLPCISFQLPPLSPYRTGSGRVYRADTVAFGMVEIKTRHDLTQMKSLYLIHPWLDTLLEGEDKGNVIIAEDVMPPPSPNTDDEEIPDKEIDNDQEFFDANDDSSSLAEPEPLSEPPSAHMAPIDREMCTRRLIAHLRQPFSALLLASTGGRAVDYKRVATDSLITVRFQENVSLTDFLYSVRTFDVL
ncbi:hypothetical protein OG21DRAFT_1460469 [Imleria badia]|nr:hypothetical protein OG21DRAFT_1460469 [Imleria badia]